MEGCRKKKKGSVSAHSPGVIVSRMVFDWTCPLYHRNSFPEHLLSPYVSTLKQYNSLDFSLAEEANRSLIGSSPEFLLGKAKRVEEANHRVALLRQVGQVRRRFLELRGSTRLVDGRGEGGGGAEKGEEDSSSLHGEIFWQIGFFQILQEMK